jgi:hypothetical protein
VKLIINHKYFYHAIIVIISHNTYCHTINIMKFIVIDENFITQWIFLLNDQWCMMCDKYIHIVVPVMCFKKYHIVRNSILASLYQDHIKRLMWSKQNLCDDIFSKIHNVTQCHIWLLITRLVINYKTCHQL